MTAVLHTWGRDLSYNPHVHFVVAAGGLSADGKQWLPSRVDTWCSDGTFRDLSSQVRDN